MRQAMGASGVAASKQPALPSAAPMHIATLQPGAIPETLIDLDEPQSAALRRVFAVDACEMSRSDGRRRLRRRRVLSPPVRG